MVERHVPLAEALARGFPSTRTYADRRSDAFLGLTEAAGSYDSAYGAPFSSYARWRIKGAIVDGERVFHGRRRRQLFAAMDAAYMRFLQANQREPQGAELAETLGISKAELYERQCNYAMLQQFWSPLRWDHSTDSKEHGRELHELIRDQSLTTEEQLLEDSLDEDLEFALETLPSRERIVVGLHFWGDTTGQDIALVLRVSPSRVSQILRSALERLKIAMETRRSANVGTG